MTKPKKKIEVCVEELAEEMIMGTDYFETLDFRKVARALLKKYKITKR